MCPYSEAVQADVKRRMSPPHRQSVAKISQDLGIQQATCYNWIKGWTAADKFTVVLESAGFNDTKLSGYCRERGLFPEQVDSWRQTAPTEAKGRLAGGT